MKITELLEAKNVGDISAMTWYHGSGQEFSAFDASRAGRGVDQEGPGFYLTSDKNDALVYGAKIMQFKISVKKLVPLSGAIPVREVTALIKAAPDLEDTLSDWGEEFNKALRSAINSVVQYSKGPKDAFEQIWYDFYRDNPDVWLQNMVKLGYTGFVLDRANGINHFICFDKSALTRIA